MSGLVEFLAIAWPGLLVLAGFVALIIHAAREHRRRHPRGRWRVRFEGPRGILTAEHDLTEQEARQVTEVARRMLGEPLTATSRPGREEGRVLANRRDDLIAQGVDPRQLLIPLVDAMTSAHSRGLHRGEHADPDCFHCAVRDGTEDRWPA
jgi:hypothetical protein